ncbi:MAG: tRNA lysidine(34) synthetase TilS, partial [Armatimonadota bacterium]
MANRGQKLLVGVSGGPDSIALLHALHMVSGEMRYTIHAAHLNHSFRGAESDEDADYVRDFTVSLGVPSIIEKIDVPAECRTRHMSPEQTAREIRYEFLHRVAVQTGADRIVVAHTADDQIETCLLNLLRGTGIDGLAGIPPVRDSIIRPLINTRKCEVEEYLRRHDLHPRIDSTNLKPIYRRNQIRLELLPYLRHHYNSNIDDVILRLVELAGDDSAYLNTEADRILKEIITDHTDDSLIISVSALLKYSIAINRRIIREALRTIVGDITDIGYIHVESIINLVDNGRNFSVDLPDNTTVIRVYDDLVFIRCILEKENIAFSHPILIPGDTEIPEIDAIIRTAVSDVPIDYRRSDRSSDIIVDFDSIQGYLHVRNWQPGDRIYPLGLGGSKKVQDIFSDMKIPKSQRSRIPVIADSKKIIWISG